MTAQIISGAELAATIRAGLAEETAKLKESGVEPGLAVILVGDDPASHSYVKGKQKRALKWAFVHFFTHFRRPSAKRSCWRKSAN